MNFQNQTRFSFEVTFPFLVSFYLRRERFRYGSRRQGWVEYFQFVLHVKQTMVSEM